MVFYERRKKKDLKLLINDDKVDEAKSAGIDVQYDEKTKEHFKLVKYREGVDGEKPSEIYTKVYDDNKKFTFENDIYSQEFFDFIKKILENVATLTDDSELSHELRSSSMEVAQKVLFDILARCFENGGMKSVVEVMISIFSKDDKLVQNFVQSLLDNNNAEQVLEILFDCTDKISQNNTAYLMKYLLCRLKTIEKETLLSMETETIQVCSTNEEGVESCQNVQRPKAICARFMQLLLGNLRDRAAKAWSRFEYYLDIILGFGVHSDTDFTEMNDSNAETPWSTDSEGCRIGFEYYFKIQIIEVLLDFMLGDSSPLKQPGETRVSMGGSYTQPNFTPIMKLITTMMTDAVMLEKFPLSPAT
jgi:hypothetical protein